MEYRNAKYNAQGSIDCEINHPQLGWIPFTASRNDPEPHGQQMFKDLERVADQYRGEE